MIRLVLVALAWAAVTRAQDPVTVTCSPQPIAATASSGQKAMGPWACWVVNSGTTPYVLTPAKLYTTVASKISPISPAVATQIIHDSIYHLPKSKAVRVAQWLIVGAGIGATVYTGNAEWSLAAGLIGQNTPAIVRTLQEQIPAAEVFTGGQISGPVTILPGGDIPPITVYAMKVKAANLQPFTVNLR